MVAKKFSFIHAADIHLGSILSPAADNVSRQAEDMFRNAVFNGFDRICKAAVQYQVDFVVLSGDVYDADSRSVKANHFFMEKCRELNENGIFIYIIAGNHDPLNKDRELFKLPDNVVYFDSEELEIKEVHNKNGDLIARVLGLSYRGKAESRKMYSSYTSPDASVVNIGLLHTQLDPANKNYVPCSLNELLSKKDIHYWALGHIHQCSILNSKNPVVAYPGIPQGRDFGEEKTGGCLLVEFDFDDEPHVSFIPTSSLIWYRIPVDINSDPINPPENLGDLKNLMISEGEKFLSGEIELPEKLDVPSDFSYDFFDGYIVQWILSGRGEIHQELTEDEEAADYLASELKKHFIDRRPFIWTDSVVIRTGKSLPTLSQLKKESSIGREIDEIINNPDFKDRVEKEFGQIWEMKSDHENINEEKFQLNDETYERIIKQAVDLIIEKMLEKEGRI